MNGPIDQHAETLDGVRTVLGRIDPIPQRVTEFAKAALGWRRLDADLAELLGDSALEAGSVSLARSGDAGARFVTFRGSELTIDIEIRADGDARALLGQLAPAPASATVEVQAGDGSVLESVAADAFGRFRLRLDNGGCVRLRVFSPEESGTPVETSWFSL